MPKSVRPNRRAAPSADDLATLVAEIDDAAKETTVPEGEDKGFVRDLVDYVVARDL